MKNYIVLFFTLTLAGAAVYAGINSNTYSPSTMDAVKADTVVKRGKYLVDIMGCHDCHSPRVMTPNGPAPDPERLLSGHPAGQAIAPFDKAVTQSWALFSMGGTAMVGPWGVSYAANLTSDKTGIGGWTEARFAKAIREGKFMGLDNTRPILPPMPWQSYAKLTDRDLHAIFTYLKSTRPVKNTVPEAVFNR